MKAVHLTRAPLLFAARTLGLVLLLLLTLPGRVSVAGEILCESWITTEAVGFCQWELGQCIPVSGGAGCHLIITPGCNAYDPCYECREDTREVTVVAACERGYVGCVCIKKPYPPYLINVDVCFNICNP